MNVLTSLRRGVDRYTENYVTEGEFAALPARVQEQVKRHASHNAQPGGGGGWNLYYSPAVTTNRYKRVGEHWRPPPQTMLLFLFVSLQAAHQVLITDWLREKTYFEGLVRRDSYAISRLGYKAPNIFVMQLVS